MQSTVVCPECWSRRRPRVGDDMAAFGFLAINEEKLNQK